MATPRSRRRSARRRPAAQITPIIDDQAWWEQYDWPPAGPDGKLLCNIENCSSGGKRLLYKNFNTHLHKHGQHKPQNVNPPKEKTFSCRHAFCTERYAYSQTRWKHETKTCKHRPTDFKGWRKSQPEPSESDNEDVDKEASGSQMDANTAFADSNEEEMQTSASETSSGSLVGMRRISDDVAGSGDDRSSKDIFIFSGAPTKQQRLLRAFVGRRDGETMFEDAKIQEGRRNTRERRKRRAAALQASFESPLAISPNEGGGEMSLAKHTVVRQLARAKSLGSVSSPHAHDIDGHSGLHLSEHVAINPPNIVHNYEAHVARGTIPGNDPVFLVLSAEQAKNLFPNGRPMVTVIVPTSLDAVANAQPLLVAQDIFSTLSTHDAVAERTSEGDEGQQEPPDTRPTSNAIAQALLEDDKAKTSVAASRAGSNANAECGEPVPSHGADLDTNDLTDQHGVQLGGDEDELMEEAPAPTATSAEPSQHAGAASGRPFVSPIANTACDAEEQALQQQINFWEEKVNERYWKEFAKE